MERSLTKKGATIIHWNSWNNKAWFFLLEKVLLAFLFFFIETRNGLFVCLYRLSFYCRLCVHRIYFASRLNVLADTQINWKDHKNQELFFFLQIYVFQWATPNLYHAPNCWIPRLFLRLDAFRESCILHMLGIGNVRWNKMPEIRTQQIKTRSVNN